MCKIKEKVRVIGYMIYDFIDCLYGRIIRKKRKEIKSSEFSLESMMLLKEISKEAYPASFIVEYESMETIEDACTHFGCCLSQIEFIHSKNYYMIIIHHFNGLEIVDFAGRNGRCDNFPKIVAYLKKNYSKKRIFVRARDTTSYPIIKCFEKHNWIKIVKDTKKEYFGEQFHNIIFYIY